MVKEAKNIDFYTSGRQPSKDDFTRISEWIRVKKTGKNGAKKPNKKPKHPAQNDIVP